jgi:hypothetical protein
VSFLRTNIKDGVITRMPTYEFDDDKMRACLQSVKHCLEDLGKDRDDIVTTNLNAMYNAWPDKNGTLKPAIDFCLDLTKTQLERNLKFNDIYLDINELLEDMKKRVDYMNDRSDHINIDAQTAGPRIAAATAQLSALRKGAKYRGDSKQVEGHLTTRIKAGTPTRMSEVRWHDLPEYLPSRMTPTKMAEVTYIDLNKYVIVQWSKWVDPVSGKIHRVEYRDRKYPPSAVDMYDVHTLEKWQDGVPVETLSARQLLARIENWPYGPEPAIPVQVWRQLGRPSYDVRMQWKKNEGDDIHLVEIRKYHMSTTFDLIYDGEFIYHGNQEMLQGEEKYMNNWLIHRILQDINTYRDKLSSDLQDWWGQFYSNTTEDTFAITEYNYVRVRLALENLRYYYRQKGEKCPPSLAVDQCKQALDIFSRMCVEEKLRVIGERLAHQIKRLNKLRSDVLHLKGYVFEQRIYSEENEENIPNSNEFEREFEAISELFPVKDTYFVVFDMENRLSKDIDVKLGAVQQFLTYFHVPDYSKLAYIEKNVKVIRDALRELLKDNKSTVTEYSEALKKTSEESNGENNPPTGDSAAPEEAKGDKKPGLWDRVNKWNPFGKGGNIKSLLLELKALGDEYHDDASLI